MPRRAQILDLEDLDRLNGVVAGMQVVRELTQAEAEEAPREARPAGVIKRLRTTHHAIARILAEGASDEETSFSTGYNPEYIRMLKRDPAFRELLAFYMVNDNLRTVDYRERVLRLGLTAAEILQERLDDPEQEASIPTGQLREIMKDSFGIAVPQAAGASGGPGANVNISVEFVKPKSSATVVDLELDR